jgi:hypothetical protein
MANDFDFKIEIRLISADDQDLYATVKGQSDELFRFASGITKTAGGEWNNVKLSLITRVYDMSHPPTTFPGAKIAGILAGLHELGHVPGLNAEDIGRVEITIQLVRKKELGNVVSIW